MTHSVEKSEFWVFIEVMLTNFPFQPVWQQV
jgi:hypothetical protein